MQNIPFYIIEMTKWVELIKCQNCSMLVEYIEWRGHKILQERRGNERRQKVSSQQESKRLNCSFEKERKEVRWSERQIMIVVYTLQTALSFTGAKFGHLRFP